MARTVPATVLVAMLSTVVSAADNFTSPQAIAAKSKYGRALEALAAEYADKIAGLQAVYERELREAHKAALDDTNETAQINAARTKLQREPNRQELVARIQQIADLSREKPGQLPTVPERSQYPQQTFLDDMDAAESSVGYGTLGRRGKTGYPPHDSHQHVMFRVPHALSLHPPTTARRILSTVWASGSVRSRPPQHWGIVGTTAMAVVRHR